MLKCVGYNEVYYILKVVFEIFMSSSSIWIHRIRTGCDLT